MVQRDITKLEADALVTGAATTLQPDRGGPRGLKRAAGVSEIQKECDEKEPIGLGEAVQTGAYDLDAEYVIHAAIREPTGDVTESAIRDATTNALNTADTNNCESIALPVLGMAPSVVETPALERRASCVFEEILEHSPTTLTRAVVVSNNHRVTDETAHFRDPVREVAKTVRQEYDDNKRGTDLKSTEDPMWRDSIFQFGLPVVIHRDEGTAVETDVMLADETMRIDERIDVQVGDIVEYKDDGRTFRIEEALPRPDSGYTAYKVSPA